ncbi:hypothetical protein E6W39_05445 [Kitasatospora acidiphila]|uniref:Uncharacterized protein n=1 Tax=Kitasatospora acidiphila TaxID=2567942 RepID=A0A540VYE6_9ACTN|nr:hypothetical protein [Kitasatospora acidiphila]TQF01800.1 hypothetical protein E6W39_05445 [Kitasatospora acidiphila]
MSNDTPATGWQSPATAAWSGPAHPAGEIRLATSATVGRRARLLAALPAPAIDPYCTLTSPFPTCSVTGH